MNISIGNLGGSNPSVNELISQLVSKRTQSLNSLLEQKSSIENTLAALQSGGLGIGSLNNSYSSQIASLQDTIDRLNEQYTLNANKITTINSLKKSYNSTVTSLDKYLESLKNPNNAGKDLDIYLDGNKVSSNDKVNVTVNDKDTNIQEITLNVTQLATTSKLFSNVLIGGNVSENTLITDLFAGLYDETKNSITTNRQDIKESLKLSELGITSGSFNIGSSKITIDADTDTIGSVIQKIKDAGYNAQIVTKEFDSNGEAVGSFMISGADGKSIAITSQTTNFASQMGLTVSEGNFYINGAEFNITDTTTLGSLINDINAASADNVGAKLENGKLVFVASETGEVDINVEKGTSNFTNAIGFTVGGVMNTTNLVMGTDGSFVTLTGTKDGISSTDSVANGKFTAGNFNVYYNEVDEHGNVSDTLTKVIIEVTEDNTIESIIQKIEDQTKGSYVDEEGKTIQTGLTAAVVDGHFQIRQLQKGAEFSISVEAGSSNFTNYVGMTSAINAQTSKDAENSYVLGSVKVPASGFSEGSFTISTNKVSDDGKTALFEMATATITVEAGDTAESIAQKITDAGIGLTASITEDGFFKIEQNNSGVDFDIKIEAGGTDFTYKAGLTADIISTGVLSPGSTDLQYTSLTGSAEVDENTSVSGGTFKINGITININAGTISSAIDDINAYKDQTGVNAFLKDGHLVLQANETGPNHTLYIEGGTSNIGTVAGFLTKTETAAAATIGQNGSKSTLTGAYNITESSMITAGSIVINGHTINLNAGSLKDAITEINKHSSDTKVTASISNGKFVLTSTENGAVNITASAGTSNIAQVTGIAAYQSQAGTQEIIGASKTTLTAAATGLKETDVIGESVISINGQKMTLSGTLKSAINTINANSGFTGVEAYLDSQGRFVFQNVNTGSKGINFVSLSGDFTRVIGAASSTTTAGSSSQVDRTPASMHGGTTGLELNTEIIGGGTLTINGHDISLDGISSINGVINAINSAKIGVTASLDDDGRFVISALDPMQTLNVSYSGKGNFGYVAGIGSYTIGAAEGSSSTPGTDGTGGTGGTGGSGNNGLITGGNTVLGTAVPELSNTLTGSNTIATTHLTEAEAKAQGYGIIKTAADLKNMYRGGKYMLVNDIDLSGITWTPLFLYKEFTGTLDGNGYEIKNLKVDYSSSTNSSSYASLLGHTKGATIKNLGIQLNSINSSGGYIGALAGMAQDTTISNCYVTGGTVSSQGGTVVGGLVGCFSGTMTNSYSTATVWTSNTTAGGLVGLMTSGSISSSYATGPVVAQKGYVGGFAGSMNNGSIINSYSTGTVNANGSSDPTTTVNIGGFIGNIAGGKVSNSYTTSNVNYSTGSTYIGSFAGNAHNPSSMLSNNKARNTVSSFGAIGNPNVQANSSQVELLSNDQFGNSSSFSGWNTSVWDFSSSTPQIKTIIRKPSYTTSTININGTDINITGTNYGSTIDQAINSINAKTSTTGVKASIKNGKFVLETVNSDTEGIDIKNVRGTFLAVVGIAETSNTPVMSVADISASEININGVDISLSASSVTTALSTINLKTAQTGVVASIEGGKFILKNQDGSTDNIYFFNNSGNFAEVTGLEQTGKITEEEAQKLGYTVIKTAQDLQNINNNLNGKYILMDNIDLSGVSWTQLGQFRGEFNGNGYTIKNLTSNTESAGLFSELSSATVRNLIIDNAEITGVGKAGALAGDASQYSYIYNVSVINSDISAAGDNFAKVGGIIGNLQQSSTIYVANVANTTIASLNNTSYAGNSGGIAGYVQMTSAVSNVAVTDTTINGRCSGGIAGYLHAISSISYAYVSDTVTVTGSLGAGGVVATTSYNGNTISNAYVSASINCSNQAGGFVGSAMGLTVSDSYFDGSMSQSGAALIHTGHNAYGQVSIVNSGWASTASSGYAVTKDYVDAQEYNNTTPISSSTFSLSKENLYNKVQNLGWNTDLWDFSGEMPQLKFAQDVGSIGSSTSGGGYTYTGAEVSGLKGGTQLFGLTDGTVVIKDEDGNSYTVNVSSTDTVNDVLDKMTEALGGIITDAYVKDGKVIIESTKELSFDENASTSNFLKLTGLSETATIFQGYGVITDPSAGFVRVTGSVSGLENGDILGGVKDGNLVLSQGSHTQTISVSSTDTVLALINKINATADFEAGLDASGHFYIQSKHESTEAIKIDTSNAVNIDEILGLTAGTFTGSLTESLGAQGHIQVTGTVGLTPDTNNGVQTGTNTIISTPHISEEQAISQGYTIIKTAQDLLNIENNLSGRYMLVNDIDLSGYSNWNGIGNSYSWGAFKGIFDGNGYTISNLKITGKQSDTDYDGGLFAYINGGAEIRNLTIKNANISGDNVNAGALAGCADSVTIKNVAVIGGSISATKGSVGGLIGNVKSYGNAEDVLIENCYSTANVSCYSPANINGYNNVGGLFGEFAGTIKESYSAGTVTYKGNYESVHVGGLVGQIGDSIILNSYSTANVNGGLAKSAGGFIGAALTNYDNDTFILQNCWSSGKVTGDNNCGGFLGLINNSDAIRAQDCYWNTTTSGLSKGYGTYLFGYGISSYSLSGLTSSQFSSASNFKNYSSNIWEFTSNGPTLIDLKDTKTQVTAGTISINGTNISISAGSIDDAIAQINAKTGTTGVVASIENNKVVFRYKDGRTDGLNIKAGSSNFVSVTGTAFVAKSVNEKVIPAANSGSGKTFTISTASTGDTFSVNITSGMTIKQLFEKINASGLYSAAFNSENKVVITALKDGMTDITFGGTSNLQSYLGLTGGGSSNVQGDLQLGTSDSYSTLTGGAIVNTDMTFSEGDFSITAGGKTETFHVAEGETITSVLNKITASDVGVSASIQNGKVVLTATTGGNVNLSIQDGTSNFVELAGFVTSGGDQIVSVVKGELATYTSQNTVETAENLGISAGDFYIHLTDADGNITDTAKIDISENEDIASIIGKINNSGLGITATVNDSGKLVLQRNSSEEAGGILVSKGSSDFTNKIGFTSGGYQAPATEYGSQSVLTSVNPISTSQKFSEGDFIISIDDNGTIRETTIDVSASDSIYDIIDKINAADAGVTASLNASNKLVITKDADTGEGSITLKKGSSDFTTIFGFTSGGIYNGTTLDGEAATHTVLVSNKLSVSGKATMASLGVTEGSFKINGVEISISSTDTIEDVIGRINTVFNDAAYKDIAVYAEFKNNQIVITTKDASSNARITIESGSTNFTEVVGFTDIGSRDNVVDMGQNAEFNIKIGDDEVGKDFSLALDLNDITNDNIYNGNNLIYLDASGNVVSSANNAAITIELKQTGETVITLGKNLLDASIIELNKFIGNFNKAMIASENEILSDDTEFAKLITNIKEALTNDVADMRKIQQQLADIGITVDIRGGMNSNMGTVRLYLDKEKYTDAFYADSQHVLDLLVGKETAIGVEDGVLTRLNNVLFPEVNNKNGYFNKVPRQLEAIQKQLKREITQTTFDLNELKLAVSGDNGTAGLSEYLEKLEEQYNFVNEAIANLNKQYATSVTRLILNQNNSGFNPIV